MNKVGDFLQTRWGAVVLWVVVMYVTAGLWNVIDEDSWYAFPSYVITVLAWAGSFLYMLASFIEFTDGKLQFRSVAPRPAPPPEPAADAASADEGTDRL